MEAQIEKLCAILQQQNQENIDATSKATRHTSLVSIQSSLQLLKEHPIVLRRRAIPPLHTLHMMVRNIGAILSTCCSILVLHTLLILYFGLAPHLMVYTCSSLVSHNYAQFDFISTPSLVKSAACLGLTYTTGTRNQGILVGIEQLRNGTRSLHDTTRALYHHSHLTLYELYEGKRGINRTQVYQDLSLIEEYTQWTLESIWYGVTHSASQSTRVFIKWLNKKTQVIVALRDAFIELPVIKHIREAVKAVEETVEHHVIRPIREKIRDGVQCLVDGISYFGKRLIQWGKTVPIGEEVLKLHTNVSA